MHSNIVRNPNNTKFLGSGFNVHAIVGSIFTTPPLQRGGVPIERPPVLNIVGVLIYYLYLYVRAGSEHRDGGVRQYAVAVARLGFKVQSSMFKGAGFRVPGGLRNVCIQVCSLHPPKKKLSLCHFEGAEPREFGEKSHQNRSVLPSWDFSHSLRSVRNDMRGTSLLRNDMRGTSLLRNDMRCASLLRNDMRCASLLRNDMRGTSLIRYDMPGFAPSMSWGLLFSYER